MLSPVYVCKESVEHPVTEGEGRYHHRGDEEVALGCVLTLIS